MGAELRAQVDKMRAGRILDGEGNPIEKTGMLAFGTEPNPDADDGTYIGTLVDVTRPDEASPAVAITGPVAQMNENEARQPEAEHSHRSELDLSAVTAGRPVDPG
jgi:hypothetical protein